MFVCTKNLITLIVFLLFGAVMGSDSSETSLKTSNELENIGIIEDPLQSDAKPFLNENAFEDAPANLPESGSDSSKSLVKTSNELENTGPIEEILESDSKPVPNPNPFEDVPANVPESAILGAIASKESKNNKVETNDISPKSTIDANNETEPEQFIPEPGLEQSVTDKPSLSIIETETENSPVEDIFINDVFGTETQTEKSIQSKVPEKVTTKESDSTLDSGTSTTGKNLALKSEVTTALKSNAEAVTAKHTTPNSEIAKVSSEATAITGKSDAKEFAFRAFSPKDVKPEKIEISKDQLQKPNSKETSVSSSEDQNTQKVETSTRAKTSAPKTELDQKTVKAQNSKSCASFFNRDALLACLVLNLVVVIFVAKM